MEKTWRNVSEGRKHGEFCPGPWRKAGLDGGNMEGIAKWYLIR
jgi:hypothetical protein